MERILVVVFDNEKKAYEGESALMHLQNEGLVTVFDRAVIVKHADGTVSLRQIDEAAPLGSLAGSAVGGLVGLLGGPVGVAIGAGSGLTLGALFDLDHVRIDADFLDDVSKSLTPTRVAVVAEVEEEWTTPLDTRREALGGTVLRRALCEVEKTVREEEIAAMKADLKQLKSEMSEARADRRAKLQKKVDQLQAKVDAQVAKAKQQHDAFAARQKSKKDVLKSNAGHPDGSRLRHGPGLSGLRGCHVERVARHARSGRVRFLDGIDTGGRFHALADAWAAKDPLPWNVFNDLHAIMALVGAGRQAEGEAAVARLEAFAYVEGGSAANRVMVTGAGRAAARSLAAFGRGDDREVSEQLAPVRHHLSIFGGSHAQRDAYQRTLLTSALRAGEPREAHAAEATRASHLASHRAALS